MRLLVASAALAVFSLMPVTAGYAPALSQDFSITNQAEPADAGRRDLMKQLQAWWDVHAYYPRHASESDEGGTVKIRLRILPDGRIWMITLIGRSGSRSLNAAGSAVFRDGFVRPFPEGAPEANIDISLHYVLAHRQDQPEIAGYTPGPSKGAFTIMNDAVKSPILETMLRRTCTGAVMRNGIRNHPAYGWRSGAEAIFFRKPDGTPWVKFYEGGYPNLSPVVEIGKAVQWVGREEHLRGGQSVWTQYTVWPDGDNKLVGNIVVISATVLSSDSGYDSTGSGTADFTCATEVMPAVAWNNWFSQTMVSPPGDPP